MAVLALFAVVPAASAQWLPARSDDPVRVEARASAEGVRIRLSIDEGWYVYGTEAEGLGLPLHVLPGLEDRRLSLSLEQPPEIVTLEGRRVPIHRERVEGLIEIPPGGVDGELRVRWAACRGDLCIPRVSRVAVGA